MRTLVPGLAIAALAATTAPSAHAQDAGGLNAHAFALTAQDGDIRDHYATHRPGSLTELGWFAGAVAEYAHRPLVVVTEDEGGDTVQAALNNVVALNATAGISPIDRLRISASAPIFLTSTSFGESQGFAMGDVRVDAMALLVDPDDTDGIGVAIVPWIDLPTGATGKYLGRRGVAGGGVIAATVEEPTFTLTSNIGVQGEPGLEDRLNLIGGPALIASAGGNYLIDDVSSIGIEARVQAALSTNDRSGAGSPGEAILSYRRTSDSGAWLTGGVAAPITGGAGAAVFRIFVGGGFGKMDPSGPRDRDGDRDRDPVSVPELVVNVTWRGEPLEGADLTLTGPEGESREALDGATFRKASEPDTMWKVVGRKGDCLQGEAKQLVNEGPTEVDLDLELVPSATLKLRVADEQGNAIPGVQVRWDTDTPECVPETFEVEPNGQARVDIGPGRHKLVVGAPGYRVMEAPVLASPGDELPVAVTLPPSKLKVTGDGIEILEQVNFETGKAVIRTDSFDLLNEVAEVIRRNPEGRIEVQGHTDDRGAEMDNLMLSQSRAEAVRNYLISRGVDRERLIATGYGEKEPVADNGTAAGRAANRRVVFRFQK